MNNEETILDPQYTTESKVKEENKTVVKNGAKASKGSGIAGKVASAAVGVAAGVAGTIYADDVKAAVMPNTEEVVKEEETPEQATNPQDRTTTTSEPSSNPTPEPQPQQRTDDGLEVVGVKHVDVDGDGRADTVVQLKNGIHLVDTDGDGEADIAMKDLNGNGQLDDGEYAYVSDEHIAMPGQEAGAVYAGNQTQDTPVEVVEVRHLDMDGDGTNETAALLNNGIVLVDDDNDGKADFAMKDVNGNGTLDDGEIVDVTAENIAMPQSGNGAIYASQESDDLDVHVLNVGQADLNGDGIAENVAVVDVEGNEVLLVDIDQDNTADVLIRNENGTNHAYDITDEDIDMPTMSDGDMYMASADSEPDYTNDADIDLFDA